MPGAQAPLPPPATSLDAEPAAAVKQARHGQGPFSAHARDSSNSRSAVRAGGLRTTAGFAQLHEVNEHVSTTASSHAPNPMAGLA